MGLFDFLGKKKPGQGEAASDREVSRFERIVGNKLSQNIDRQEAIDALSKMGTRASAAAVPHRLSPTFRRAWYGSPKPVTACCG